MYFAAGREFLNIHREMVVFATHIEKTIALAHENIPGNPLSGGALRSIRTDQLAFHRAVLTLCSGGWAFAAAPVLRTMLDLIISVAVITENREESEFRGFKYSHKFFQAYKGDKAFSEEQRLQMRRQVKEGIDLLPRKFQEKARDFIFKERTSPYWFYPEYPRPTKVVDKFFPDDVAEHYKMFSGGTHGGFIGLRILKDNPDDIHPNPRADERSQRFALIGSTRFTFELFKQCDRFEAAGVNEELSKSFFESFQKLGQAFHFLKPQ